MKKDYITPQMEVLSVDSAYIICASDVNNGNDYNSGNSDYIGGDEGGDWNVGYPD
ncbi:MAG: hypothetical protein Q4F34_08885 [Prevotellaceae bacterium]|nr:hypothetical protein [Prevotellaceae bacterium]